MNKADYHSTKTTEATKEFHSAVRDDIDQLPPTGTRSSAPQ